MADLLRPHPLLQLLLPRRTRLDHHLAWEGWLGSASMREAALGSLWSLTASAYSTACLFEGRRAIAANLLQAAFLLPKAASDL